MKFNWKTASILLLSSLLTGCQTLGSDVTAIGNVLVNFSQSFPAIWQMLTSLAYVLGFAFAFRSIYYLKIYGESRAMMPTQGSMKTPVVYMIAAMALIYLPTTFEMLTESTFGSTSPLDLQRTELTSEMALTTTSALATQALLYFIQLIGLISFLRGWLLIAHTTQQSHHNALSKGFTHIVGGLLAVNIGLWIRLVRNTFGL